jgi:anti-sigma factor RsiW
MDLESLQQDEWMQAPNECQAARAAFSSYLDGVLSGVEMGLIAAHLVACAPCTNEFEAWRSMQTALGELGSAKAPDRLQAQLRTALSIERERGTYLSLVGRVAMIWKDSIAPMAVQGAGGLVAALILAAGAFRLFGPGVIVQANDDGLADLVAPHYLYSQVPPQPIQTGREVPVLVDAKVNTRGMVYDYTIIDGPADPAIRARVEQNLLSSVFKPATVFGVPVDGHVMVTYTGVSVRG